MLSIGGYSIEYYHHGFLSLDGGAMFGSIPRPLWEKKIHPDSKHRIRLATRSLLLRGHKKVILVDVGCGDKWNEKEQKIFAFEDPPKDNPLLKREEVTDILLTHLHFDHAGGLTHKTRDETLALSYPDATIWLQEENYALGQHPNRRERASYLASHIEPLQKAKLHLLQGADNPFPNISVGISNGHTRGLQWIRIAGADGVLYYPSDLIPTSHHISLPYHMGYDMCAEKILQEKEALLEQAFSDNAIITFEHDPDIASVTVRKNAKGNFEVADILSRDL